MDNLDWVLEAYRKAGCTIAVYDFGSNYSNIGRIAKIRPEIVKIDRSLVQAMDKSKFSREVCRAIAFFSEVLGSQVLFEGIEEESQLESSIDMCGYFLQSFLLGKPAADFSVSEKNASELLKKCFRKSQVKQDDQSGYFHAILRLLEHRLDTWKNLSEDGIREVLCGLPDYCKRIYVCDRRGHLVTTTLERTGHDSVVGLVWPESSSLFFRSFFLDCLHVLDAENRSLLSRRYRDIHTKKYAVTFCYHLSVQRILFIDIDYNAAWDRYA